MLVPLTVFAERQWRIPQLFSSRFCHLERRGGCFVGRLVSSVNEASVLRGPLSDLRAVDFCVCKQ